MPRIVVIGAGLAGLVAARHLADAGYEVLVFERDATVGGRVGSREVDGFTVDHGFQVLFTAYPAARRELDLADLDLRRFPPGAVIARPGHRSPFADPFREPGVALSTLRTGEASLGDKLRLLALLVELRARSSSELFPGPARSIREHLALRGFSERFVDAFLKPFYGGITLDRSLSSAAAVFTYTFKMLAKGTAALPAEGMAAIPEQLAARASAVGATIQTDTPVSGVTVDREGPDSGVRIELETDTATADAAIMATDPLTAADLTGLETIPTEGRGCATQYYSLPEPVELRTGGRLLLNAAGAEPTHIAPLSAVAPEYAPPGKQLLAAVFLDPVPEDDETLAARSREALEAWYPDRSFDDLGVLATDRIPFAQFDQPPGRHASLPEPDDPAGPVYLAGDYTRWSSIQGALRSGRDAAQAVRNARP
ncbi:MAG: NAD(P)/FAD-dependent oxidoreductase [Halobacteriales archaeon]